MSAEGPDEAGQVKRTCTMSCDAAVDFETVVEVECYRSEANAHLRQVASQGRVERSK